MTRFNLSEWAIRHRAVVAYFMIAFVVAGIFDYMRLGRSEDPDFTIKTMVVQVQWPGATMEDMLQQVTERIERKLQETPHLDYVRSYTTPGQTTIFVNLRGDTPAAEVQDIWYQVRKKVYDIRQTLPQGIVGPFFNDEFGDTYGIVYGFIADGFTHRELRDYVDDIRSRLLRVPDVSKIEMVGTQDERVFIEFSTEQMAGLGISRSALISALQGQNEVTPSGVVQTGDERILVRVSGAFRSEQDILAVNFMANNRMIRLGDIARVTRGTADPPQPLFRVNGQDAIGLAISMRTGGDVLALGRNIEHAMAEIVADLPVGIEPRMVAEQPATVEHAVDEFMEALWEAIAIVLAVSFVSLGMRAGAVVALSIPLVLAIVFVAMKLFGIDLQRISLGALIIALGLLVDDAMITVESMITRLEQGDPRERAATFAYSSTAFPMLTGTLVTVAGFVPVGFAQSSAAEYTFSIFAVVAIALITSWVVAVVFTPLLGVWILKDKIHVGEPSVIARALRGVSAWAMRARWIAMLRMRFGTSRTEARIVREPPKTGHADEPGPIMRRFRSVLEFGMRARWITILLTLGLFGASLFGARFVPQQFFPSSDRPELLVDLKLPLNSSIYASREASARLDALLRDDPDVERWSTYAGRGAVRFYLPLDVQLPNDYFAQAVVVTRGIEQRERVRARLEQALDAEFPGLVGRIYPLELGPPVGWPLQYRVSGPDLEQVREIVFRLASIMGSDAAVQRLNYNWIEPARTIRIRVDQDQARILGLASQDIAQSLNLVVSGSTVTQIRDAIYLVDVVVRASDEQRVSLETIRTLQVPLSDGRSVPLSAFASVEYGQEYPLVWRRDRRPTLTVQADVAPDMLPATVVQTLAPRVAELAASLPAGYRIEVGGSVEESNKAQASVMAVVPLMLFLMLTILMLQLQGFNRLFLVLSVAPLGTIGVVAALLVSGKPMGFVAILGVLALVGMIARNSVILIDQVETEKTHGRHPWDAVVVATMHRFRPILLTAAAAILGMIPIAPTIFWGPMAYAIMGGLAVATLLTLIFLPALYVAWFRIEDPHREATRYAQVGQPATSND